MGSENKKIDDNKVVDDENKIIDKNDADGKEGKIKLAPSDLNNDSDDSLEDGASEREKEFKALEEKNKELVKQVQEKDLRIKSLEDDVKKTSFVKRKEKEDTRPSWMKNV